MTAQFRNLIFEGGGVKGIAYVGAMQILQDRGILPEIRRVGGTSAGAINALIFARLATASLNSRKCFAPLTFETSWMTPLA
jgi:predicted acylesterase/phospholipase RssA